MLLPFVDREPTQAEVERIRLLLSTYQDGTGMLAIGEGHTLPGWRDFERSVALALGGYASESKAIFDVVLERVDAGNVPKYGISCKMRSELNRIDRDGRVTIEVSNSAGKFWDYLALKGIHQRNYREQPRNVGLALIELVHKWQLAESVDGGGNIDLRGSCYLVLSWNRLGWYQMHQFPLNLFDTKGLHWHFPPRVQRGQELPGRRLCGSDESGNIVEWYGESGGQLKYYPFASNALWQSERFQLEPLPDADHGIINKAAAYFPQKWAAACANVAR